MKLLKRFKYKRITIECDTIEIQFEELKEIYPNIKINEIIELE